MPILVHFRRTAGLLALVRFELTGCKARPPADTPRPSARRHEKDLKFRFFTAPYCLWPIGIRIAQAYLSVTVGLLFKAALPSPINSVSSC